MNKKGLSILLALSMVFSLNSMAFAEEAVVEEEAVVAAVEEDVEVTQSQDLRQWAISSFVQLRKKTSFKDGKVTISGAGLKVGTSFGGVAFYHGKKTTGTDLGLYIEDEAGYGISVKGIKLTSNKKADATGEIKFKMKTLGTYKDVYGPDCIVDDNVTNNVTEGEAKAAFKALKTKFKNAKNEELTAWVAPSYVRGSISEEAVKTLKSFSKKGSVSMADLGGYINNWGIRFSPSNTAALIKTKNGSVKKVQLVYLSPSYVKGSDHVMRYRVKTKTLKKGKDYNVNGDSITFDNLDTYSGESIKAK